MNDAQFALYLERIGHGWNVRPDLETLRSLHRAHVTAIPFEALDVQLGGCPASNPKRFSKSWSSGSAVAGATK
jgi:N-hydroxyarylamine O-acetyltransferase